MAFAFSCGDDPADSADSGTERARADGASAAHAGEVASGGDDSGDRHFDDTETIVLDELPDAAPDPLVEKSQKSAQRVTARDKKSKKKKKKRKRRRRFKRKKNEGLVDQEDGVFFRHRKPRKGPGHTLDRELEKQLVELGYLTGYEEARAVSGVTLYDEQRAYTGLNLYTSGHAPSATLMDMDGYVIHEWYYDPYEDLLKPGGNAKMGSKYMRRAHLFPNGDLLVLFDFAGMALLDKDSHLKWLNAERFHHDFQVLDDGTIYTLNERRVSSKKYGGERKFRDNAIVVLDADGWVQREISLVECYERLLPEGALLDELNIDNLADPFHANSIQVFDGSLEKAHPSYKRGNVLVSLRHRNAFMIVDPDSEEIVLLEQGSWKRQHEARLIDNGNIMLFDNLGRPKNSRVLELKPPHWRAVWQYAGHPPSSFHSRVQGTQDRLPNGNTLITESNWGRAFEVTPQHKTVWEFISPFRAADDPNLVAVLFDTSRLECDFPLDWLAASDTSAPDAAWRD